MLANRMLKWAFQIGFQNINHHIIWPADRLATGWLMNILNANPQCQIAMDL